MILSVKEFAKKNLPQSYFEILLKNYKKSGGTRL